MTVLDLRASGLVRSSPAFCLRCRIPVGSLPTQPVETAGYGAPADAQFLGDRVIAAARLFQFNAAPVQVFVPGLVAIARIDHPVGAQATLCRDRPG